MYKYTYATLALFSVVEEIIFGLPTLLLFHRSITFMLTVRVFWVLLHFANEQVRRQLRYRKLEFALNIGLILPVGFAMGLLWLSGFWYLAMLAHVGWNMRSLWWIKNRLKTQYFADFWENIDKLVREKP